jgi:hypothetical protein
MEHRSFQMRQRILQAPSASLRACPHPRNIHFRFYGNTNQSSSAGTAVAARQTAVAG